MIKLVAFDLDGTIGDTIPMCLKALKKAVTPYVTLSKHIVYKNDKPTFLSDLSKVTGA